MDHKKIHTQLQDNMVFTCVKLSISATNLKCCPSQIQNKTIHLIHHILISRFKSTTSTIFIRTLN